MSLPEISVEEQLTLFELLHPMHRLIDFWCGHPHNNEVTSVAEWTLSDWQTARVHLTPQLKQPEVKQEVIKCINQRKPFDINRFLPLFEHAISIDSSVAACLLPLWDSSHSINALMQRWQKIYPLNPVTLAPTAEEEIFQLAMSALAKLHELGYVYLEPSFELA